MTTTHPGPRATAPAPADCAAERGDCWITLGLRHGGTRAVRIAYELAGPPGAPVIAVLGGISGDRHLLATRRYPEPGWWPQQCGPGLALDTRRFRLLGIDWLGRCGGIDQPIDTADQAQALAAVLDALGIARLHALVGASYGAMVGLAFAASHGERLRQLVAISGADRADPWASAWRGLQRAILRHGLAAGQAAPALALARQVALLGYRTPQDVRARFDLPPTRLDDRFELACEPWLRSHGEAFASRWPATAYLRLSESLDLHAVDPGRIRVPVTLVGVNEDQVVPLSSLYALAESLAGPARLLTLRSAHGHDAFLKCHEAIAEALREAVTPAREVAA
ncbi:MAG: homoserine O-succinyltransferase [Xanthomonadales bacterium]|nr:homoserine O-succinyltransferase [Xanthomonadales bacterium]